MEKPDENGNIAAMNLTKTNAELVGQPITQTITTKDGKVSAPIHSDP